MNGKACQALLFCQGKAWSWAAWLVGWPLSHFCPRALFHNYGWHPAYLPSARTIPGGRPHFKGSGLSLLLGGSHSSAESTPCVNRLEMWVISPQLWYLVDAAAVCIFHWADVDESLLRMATFLKTYPLCPFLSLLWFILIANLIRLINA